MKIMASRMSNLYIVLLKDVMWVNGKGKSDCLGQDVNRIDKTYGHGILVRGVSFLNFLISEMWLSVG
jgi:hypothetical protein